MLKVLIVSLALAAVSAANAHHTKDQYVIRDELGRPSMIVAAPMQWRKHSTGREAAAVLMPNHDGTSSTALFMPDCDETNKMWSRRSLSNDMEDGWRPFAVSAGSMGASIWTHICGGR